MKTAIAIVAAISFSLTLFACGSKSDSAQARDQRKSNCKRGTATACWVRTMLEKGCDHGSADACYGLGVMLQDDAAGMKDVVAAHGLFMKGCDGGEVRACLNLGFLDCEMTAGFSATFPQCSLLYDCVKKVMELDDMEKCDQEMACGPAAAHFLAVFRNDIAKMSEGMPRDQADKAKAQLERVELLLKCETPIDTPISR